MISVSPASSAICFINQIDITLKTNPSNKISPNFNFATPATVRFTKENPSDSDSGGLVVMTAVVSQVNKRTITQKYYSFQHYFTNNVCIFWNNAILVGGCTDINVVNAGVSGSYIAETTFTSLNYQLSENVDIYTRFSTPLQREDSYVEPSKLTVSVNAQNL